MREEEEVRVRELPQRLTSNRLDTRPVALGRRLARPDLNSVPNTSFSPPSQKPHTSSLLQPSEKITADGPTEEPSPAPDQQQSARRRNSPASADTHPNFPQASKISVHQLNRTLTHRLLKSTSLWELDQLLRAHDTVHLNLIHLAAAARQSVLLGGTSRPTEARKLLDRHLERWATATAEIRREEEEEQPVQRAESGVVDEGARCSSKAKRLAGSQLDTSPWSGGEASITSREGASEYELLEGPPAEGAGAAAASSSTGSDLLPLSEVGDVLWAYGKLRCKPPAWLWLSALRPILLDPAALEQLRRQPADLNPASTAPWAAGRKQRTAAAGGRYRGAEDEAPRHSRAVGDEVTDGAEQTVTKLAVALARMREDDLQVWRQLARAAAMTAANASPRALSSLLWAFGTIQMTHGPFLLAAVRAMRADLQDYNGQDLACSMWALARLSPPPAAVATSPQAAAASLAARDFLYGDLSNAVRRRLRLQSFKPQELTTLVGALYEIARQHAAAQAAAAMTHEDGHPALTAVTEPPSPPGCGVYPSHSWPHCAQVPQPSPRLLRVVSQAVRKNLSSLPAGAVAEAAAAFQLLGHHDASLYRALAAGMMQRLQHMAPRHLLRAAVSLQAVGYADTAFYDKVISAAQSELQAYSLRNLLQLAKLCQRLPPNSPGLAGADALLDAGNGSGTAKAADDNGLCWQDTSPSAEGASPPSVDPGALCGPSVDVARAFLHSAVEHVVSSVQQLGARKDRGRPRKTQATSGATKKTSPSPRPGGVQDDDEDADEGGTGRAGRAGITDPPRLRQWHALLRAAASVGWRDPELAVHAVEEMMQELRRLRPLWLGAVRARAMQWAKRRRDQLALEQQHGPQILEQQNGEHGPRAVDNGVGYDAVAGDVVGLLVTTALIRQQDRVDVVRAVVGVLMEACNAEAAAEAGAGGHGRMLGLLSGDCENSATEAAAAAARRIALLGLSPAALRELVYGLDRFAPSLNGPGEVTTRVAIKMLQRRLALPEGPG